MCVIYALPESLSFLCAHLIFFLNEHLEIVNKNIICNLIERLFLYLYLADSDQTISCAVWQSDLRVFALALDGILAPLLSTEHPVID